jgi:hypothetical protein
MDDSDRDIIDVLTKTVMLAADIGRAFAPAHIKDRAGWGRKWVAKMRAADLIVDHPHGVSIRPAPKVRTGGLNLAQEFYQLLGFGLRTYLAPHANRPTPPRLHFSRYQRTPYACNH